MLYVTNMVSFVILRHPVTTLVTAFNNYCTNVSSDYGKFTSRYADIFILFKINNYYFPYALCNAVTNNKYIFTYQNMPIV